MRMMSFPKDKEEEWDNRTHVFGSVAPFLLNGVVLL
jgi:hypothetical protein